MRLRRIGERIVRPCTSLTDLPSATPMHPMKAEAQNHSHPHATRSAATRVIAVALFIVFSIDKPALALSFWHTTAPCTNWASVACSADGTKIVATVGPPSVGGIYRSTDSGATWTRTSAPVTNWSSIASSADGSGLVAAGSGACYRGPLYVSTNSGTTWRQTGAPIAYWCSVASSADGKRLVAVGFADQPGPLGPFISSDFGVTWTNTSALFTNGLSVTSSDDGQQLAAVAEGNIFVSTNAGSAWNMAGPLASAGFSVRLSGDGRILVANSRTFANLIYVSTNLGTTWTTTAVPFDTSGFSRNITSSADGRNWVLAGQSRLIISTNCGTTWDSQWAPGFPSLALSADGTRLVLACGDSGGYIYTSFITSPLLSISHSGNAFRLSWPWLIDGFAVQTISDLALTNWSDVQVTPLLSNGQYQVTLPATNNRVFFRLRHP